MRRHSTTHQLGTLAELNVTPLLDLAFVLLIIFMITAPFLAESADLIIPTSRASRTAVDPSQVFTVSVDSKGGVSLDERPMQMDELAAGILALREKKPGLAILVRADRNIPVQNVVGVMDILKQTGVAKVGLITKPAPAATP